MRITLAIYGIMTLLFFSCTQTIQKKSNARIGTIDTNISNYLIAQNSIKENEVENLLTRNFIRNINGIEMVSNINEHKANMNIFLNRFPDMVLTFSTKLIKDNQAYIGWTFTGTNTGTFGELKATGKKVKISGISHLYFDESNKIYKEDVFYNELDLIQQLGYTLNPPITE
ncbi:ester cyclase [Aureibaculum conchae]|uniref:ester cyclase n=1 Tax=Aureibaculum sp. 2308TA14-22 TaxID=3108392 RepID=UPI003396CC10